MFDVVGLVSGDGNMPVVNSIDTPLQLGLPHSNLFAVKGIILLLPHLL